ncbi:uncharacterized protein LOC128332482 [Hemicordylus capensis]|uniref:uncharacterized protein LOC128332482 n=1 Tax=Hemicordylus capensis TaxID=884348 RepID=UPI002303CD37|nr:uncharacterized protein LOC128332482 [Hemicordylus capensis]XP_053122765.1 uncharacterized protein LOC128332482 [Hemicordylus capensis]XP_053122766.1 uncharacterized protein LOC128332482 [Hemicordylus capensis]
MDRFMKKKFPQGECIIHHATTDDTKGHLVKLQSYESWITLLEAAKVRNHAPVLDVAKQLTEMEIPGVRYHRKCRIRFTLKRELETLKRKADTIVGNEAGSSGCNTKSPPRQLLSDSRVSDPACIFCGKTKYLKRTSTREKLVKATHLRTDQRLRECAVKKGDEKMLVVTSGDLVASGTHYHASCYKGYTREKTKNQDNIDEDGQEDENDVEELYRKAEREAFLELFQYIRTVIIPNKDVVVMTTLTSKLETFLQSRGVPALKDSTKKHMRRKLESELKDSIHIFTDDKGKLLVVPDSVSLKDLAVENHCLQRELNVWKAKSNQ